jgi:hypothetical protein
VACQRVAASIHIEVNRGAAEAATHGELDSSRSSGHNFIQLNNLHPPGGVGGANSDREDGAMVESPRSPFTAECRPCRLSKKGRGREATTE